ncbi:MAG: twin-arginine translocase TatA/TatE family subunit [Paludibacteraceae bacterium]|nr:twin-arginine translocase TatA/TatE family subunit [Paludibacteraceae bacterium]
MILLFIGTTEIIVIAAVVMLLFGGKKLPELMRGLGKGVKEFKEEMHEVKEEITGDNSEDKTQILDN